MVAFAVRRPMAETGNSRQGSCPDMMSFLLEAPTVQDRVVHVQMHKRNLLEEESEDAKFLWAGFSSTMMVLLNPAQSKTGPTLSTTIWPLSRFNRR